MHVMNGQKMEPRTWNRLRNETAERLEKALPYIVDGKTVSADNCVALFEALICPGDRVALEGNNQKQADFLAKCLCKVDCTKIHDIHMVQSVLSLDEHLDIFESGIASRLDFSFSGPLAGRLARLIDEERIEIGAIHTYLELYARYFVDLTPRVALVAAEMADREGNLYTGFSTEDTPIILEATKFRGGIVVVQVNEIVDKLPRVDIPGDWVDFIVKSPTPFYIEPLFTRDPALISDAQVLKAMMAIRGIYAEYDVENLNHGIGFDTAAIELLLPTYAASLGLKGKICTHFVLNPHPTLIPAIESGWVESVYCFGGELGMEDYVAARSDVFFIGPDGTMRSNRALAQVAGHYASDMFVGGTLQIDPCGNSSTATATRIAGFGGAPNMGCDAKGRRHASGAWLRCGEEDGGQSRAIGGIGRGRRLVVQIAETFREKMVPGFVNELDAVRLANNAHLSLAPVMIYGDDLTHIVTEEGVAYLHKCASLEERSAAIRGIAGFTEVGLAADPKETERLRKNDVIRTSADLGIDPSKANRSLLAAKNMKELVKWSGGLYRPPARFRNW